MYQFTEDCLTGVALLDEQHEHLFQLINEAFDLLGDPDVPKAVVKNLLRALDRYVAEHFTCEERYMEKTGDPELERQKREHAAFAEKITKMREEIEEYEGNSAPRLLELVDYLSYWLYHHILGSDIMIGKFQVKVEDADPYAFTDKFRTGIRIVDEEHARLFEIIRDANEVIHAQLLHDKYDEIMRILTELKDYTVHHFQDEEAYMERIGYDGIFAQRAAHEAFVDRLNDINLDELDDNQQEYLDELLTFLLDWLVNHILKVDKKIPVVGAFNE